MQDATQWRRKRGKSVRAHSHEDTLNEDERMLAIIPSQASVEPYAGDGPSPEVYRQTLQVISATPELEGRLNYITASVIVTVFGGWLAGKMIKTRAFFFVVDLMLFFASLATAGFLIGVLLGENILPPETVPILLFVATAIALLIVGIVLGSMLINAIAHSRRRRDKQSAGQGTVVYAPGQRTIARTRNHDGRYWNR